MGLTGAVIFVGGWAHGGPAGRRKCTKKIENPYQMQDNKAAPSAPPQGGGASRRPLGSCYLPFGKDFQCFGLISGAHPETFPHFFGDCPPSLVFPIVNASLRRFIPTLDMCRCTGGRGQPSECALLSQCPTFRDPPHPGMF